VDELKERITYSEFLEWLTFLGREEERQTKQDYYLAQIAAEIRRGHVKNPKAVKVKDFLVEVKTTPETPGERSKSVWMGALKIKKPKES